MKELMRFSLNRRFNNRATKIFNCIVFVVVACFCFADEIMHIIDPSMFEKEIIYVKDLDKQLVDYLQENAKENYVFKNIEKDIDKDKLILSYEENEYKLHSKYEIDTIVLSTFEMYINAYRKDKLLQNSDNIEVLLAYNQDIQIENVIREQNVELSKEKSNLIFVFVSGMYFMMLSFISTVASEVVNEKATKTLELILTSVSAKVHFYAKLIVGWLVIMIQGGLTLSYILFWLFIRELYDHGNGLIEFANKLKLITLKGNTFYSLLNEMELSFDFFQKLFVVILFLMLGILFMQLLIVIVSSFVSSVEEAGNLQAPFYLILLGVYYLTLAINNPHDLNEGLGYYLSFVPFLNMLLMPCRLLISEVPINQLLYSLSGSILIICIILYKGIPIYEQGVLDYSCKGFKQVFKSMRQIKRKKKMNLKDILEKVSNIKDCVPFHK